ncbi:MAG: formimidoylglutamate deiminase [Microbacterium sp.]
MTTYHSAQALIDGSVVRDVRVSEHDGAIDVVGTGQAARAGDVHLPGILLPGFANAHSHAFQRLLRARTHTDGGTFWTWRERMYRAALRLDPDTYAELATAVFAEMALTGTAAVGEFHYLHHARGGRLYSDPNAMGEALVEAARRAGVRLTLIDTLYLSGGLDDRGRELPLEPAQQRFADASFDAWATRHRALRDRFAAASDVRIAAAVHSVRAVDPALYRPFLEVVEEDEPVHAHVSEQPSENAQARAAYGRTPAEVLADAGMLQPRFTAVHLTHLTQRDVELVAGSGATACLCPSTERDLADGIGPARALADHGVPVALGSDQHVVLDVFEEARGLEHGERLASGRRGRFTPTQLLTAATTAGHRSIGHSGGRIAVGEPCDLVAVRLDSVRTAGADPAQILFAAAAGDVTDVIVSGSRIVAGGRHRLGDIGELLVRAIDRIEDGAA